MTILRKSKKRDAIYKALCSTTSHPSADWIHAKLKSDIPDLSLGTVYRNLNLFKSEGSAISVATVNGQERFDGDTEPHAHFICSKCSDVIDLRNVTVPDISDKDVKIEGYQLNYYGICSECINNEK